nr:MAG TPA: hypothetical protein [Caudoviricetes sp.]
MWFILTRSVSLFYFLLTIIIIYYISYKVNIF